MEKCKPDILFEEKKRRESTKRKIDISEEYLPNTENKKWICLQDLPKMSINNSRINNISFNNDDGKIEQQSKFINDIKDIDDNKPLSKTFFTQMECPFTNYDMPEFRSIYSDIENEDVIPIMSSKINVEKITLFDGCEDISEDYVNKYTFL